RANGLTALLSDLGDSQFPLIRKLGQGKYELHSFFKDFLHEKLITIDGPEIKRQLHVQFAERFDVLGDSQQALQHAAQGQDWPAVIRHLTTHGERLLAESPLLLKNVIESLPHEQILANLRLINLKSSALIQLGDLAGAYRTYLEVLTQKSSSAMGAD